ncbi:MAG: cytochrome C [Sphingomonas sp. 28-66-16]|nr:MAG: cytochrome C [Sphingomonas sp. 28-66-16]
MTRQLVAGLAAGALIGAAAMYVGTRPATKSPTTTATTPSTSQAAPGPGSAAVAASFAPPLAAKAPADAFGDAVRLGERLITDTATVAPAYVGNGLVCSNCHLDAGRQAGAAPLWAAFVNFPAFRKKNGEINSFQKRVQDCFLYSLNGKPPPLGSRELLAIESYAAYMARGLPSGMSPPGRGFPAIAAPSIPADDRRGAAVFSEKCASCHGPDGAGMTIPGDRSYPPLWGARSFNWGAGMATIDKAAAFIHANMPLGQAGSLSVQQAWDVATFIDGRVRPQDPRFTGSAQATRQQHHDSPFSRYGTIVDGELLGNAATTPAAGGQTGKLRHGPPPRAGGA